MPTLAMWACPSLEGMSTEAVPSPTYRDSTYLETMAVGEHNNTCYMSCIYSLNIFSAGMCRKVFAVKENQTTGEWESMELCMGDSSVCTGSLVGEERLKHILSFGEDEDGELYILTTSLASPTAAQGIVYQIVDPAK